MKAASLFLTVAACLSAQVPNPTQSQRALTPEQTGQPTPIFRVTVVSRTTKAINYHHRTGTTHIDFRGTELMPTARGEASVNSQLGSTKIETHLDHMTPASQYGPEYMTFVLWAITPEGRAMNLGEVVLEGNHANLLSTTDLQSFGLIVTAEPYFAVTQPSDVVVAENFVRTDTTGTIEQVDAKYELLQRGQYVLNRTAYQPVKIDPKGPLQLAEAENAVEIARLAGADRYAADTLQKATIDLIRAAIANARRPTRERQRRWPRTPALSPSGRFAKRNWPTNGRQPRSVRPRRKPRQQSRLKKRDWKPTAVRVLKPTDWLPRRPSMKPNWPPPMPLGKKLPPMPHAPPPYNSSNCWRQRRSRLG
jgi:hypothetical protein